MSREVFLKLIVPLCMSTLLLISCTSIKYGRMPDTSKLSSDLIQDVSTKADVLRVLGPPRGYGMLQIDTTPESYVIWFYEYIEANDTKIRLKMLLIFFNKELYEGNMWFSSFEELKERKKGGR